MDYSRIKNITPPVLDFIKEWNCSNKISAYTSGSTGRPKAIQLDRNDMIASANMTNAFFGIDAGSVLAMPLSPEYIAGKMMIVRSLVAECELHISEPSLDPLTGFESLEKIDLIPIVPAQLPALLAHGNRSERIGNIIIGGAPLSYDQEKAVAERGLNAYATYGMTETCSHVALRKIGKDSFYTALPGYSFSTDSRGCLVIKSNQMSFKTLVTNDCVEILSDTQFRWLGRADNVINTGGIKVFPEKIEAQLAPLIKNRAFYIIGRPSDRWGTEIVLVIEGSGFDKDHFFKQASEILPSRLLPKAIVEKEEIPRTSSGKIKRL